MLWRLRHSAVRVDGGNENRRLTLGRNNRGNGGIDEERNDGCRWHQLVEQFHPLRRYGARTARRRTSGLFCISFSSFSRSLSHHGRTNRRPGLCYPAKHQRQLATECRRLKSMLVSDKPPLPETSSCAHGAW